MSDPATDPADGPIFHLALPDDWAAASGDGEYRMSTRGVTLEQEGFIHCSTGAQIEETANRFYGDLERLVVLTIDPRRVPARVVFEPPAPGLDTLFPHVYGAIPITAVVSVETWVRSTDRQWSLDDHTG